MKHGIAAPSEEGAPHDDEAGNDDAKSFGTCRMCFEAGGDLIAPCRCKGTAKWVHRDCLNTWRINSLNSRALTHCCECRFQYILAESQVVNTRLQAKKWEILQRLVLQILGGWLAFQLAILAIAGITWLADRKAHLVTLFGFVRTDLLFYYVMGILGLCMMATAGVLLIVLVDIGKDLVKAYYNGRFVYEVQALVCSRGFLQMVLGGVGCYLCFSGGYTSGTGPREAVLLMIYGFLCVFPGMMTIVLLAGLHLQKGIKEYMRVSRASTVAQAYEVQDLANAEPSELGKAAPTDSTTELQSKIHQDIESIIGPQPVPPSGAPSPATGQDALRPQATLREARQGLRRALNGPATHAASPACYGSVESSADAFHA